MMKTIFSLITLVSTLGLATSLTASAAPKAPNPNPEVIHDGTSPCQPFRLACTVAGFTLTSKDLNHRLISKCMMPMANGQEVKSPATGAVVPVPVQSDAEACKANIHY